MLFRVVGSCWAKFKTDQTCYVQKDATTPCVCLYGASKSCVVCTILAKRFWDSTPFSGVFVWNLQLTGNTHSQTRPGGGGGGGVNLNCVLLNWNKVSQTFWPGLQLNVTIVTYRLSCWACPNEETAVQQTLWPLNGSKLPSIHCKRSVMPRDHSCYHA